MRRPTPLPSPGPAPDAQGRASSAAAASDAGSPDRGEPDAIAPVISITAPTPMTADAASVSSAAAESPLQAAAVGVRDVWRAARARRKALRSEVRRFTVRQRRRRAVWLGAAVSLAVLVLGTIGAAYSPLLAVERIQVVGTSRLDPDAVGKALSAEVGKPLPLVDESAVKAALVGFPLVESYTLEARPPHELVVRIVERTPIGLLQSAAGYTLVDAAGVALSTTSSRPADQPLLKVPGGVHSAAFAAIGQVLRSLPASIRSQVTAVSASSPDDVILTLGRSRASIVWGSAEDSAKKALALATAMKVRPPRTVRQYDVSSPMAIVVR